jgi:hypothetical protein
MQKEIIRGDQQYRRKLFTGYACLLVVAAGFFMFFVPFAKIYLNSLSIKTAFTIMEIAAILFLVSFIFPAVYIIGIGRAIVKHQSVPFPGMKVIYDTQVIYGAKAIMRGKLIIILGIVSILMAVAGGYSTHYFFKKFRGDPLFRTIFITSIHNITSQPL